MRPISTERLTTRFRGLLMRFDTPPSCGQALRSGRRPSRTYDLLADILTVTNPKEEKLWNSVVVNRLAELRPDAYGQWAGLEDEAKTATLTARLKEYGVKTEDTAPDATQRATESTQPT